MGEDEDQTKGRTNNIQHMYEKNQPAQSLQNYLHVQHKHFCTLRKIQKASLPERHTIQSN